MAVPHTQVFDATHGNDNKVHLLFYLVNIYLWRITLGIDTAGEQSTSV